MPVEAFLSQIAIFPFQQAPKGWAQCNGQLLPINQNQALFSLLGTTFGGNGQTTFALPDLRGRNPIHFGGGFILGQAGGEAAHTLTQAELPAHSHGARGRSALGTATSPGTQVWAAAPSQLYAGAPNAAMAPNGVQQVGGSQPHANESPYLVLNICICLQGIFPSRN